AFDLRASNFALATGTRLNSLAEDETAESQEKPTSASEKAKVGAEKKPTKAKIGPPEKPRKANQSQEKPRVAKFRGARPPRGGSARGADVYECLRLSTRRR